MSVRRYDKPKPEEKLTPAGGGGGGDAGNKTQTYVPPSLRDGAGKCSDPSNSGRGVSSIRISNLSSNTSDQVLKELVEPFGPISKLYLAREKSTGLCRGFAYVHFKSKENAHAAIKKLNGCYYDHLILKVDWIKPKT